MTEGTFSNHEDDVMKAFENLKISHLASDETQVVSSPQSKMGVIDREEWDKIIAEIDAKEQENQVAAEAAGESSAVVASRASRHSSSKEKAAESGFALVKFPKPSKKAKKEKATSNGSGDDGNGKDKKKKKHVVRNIILALLGLGVVACLVVGVIVIKIIKDAPEINPNNIYDLLEQSSTIYDINGEIIDNIYSGDALRTNAEYSEMPKDLVNAFVCIEDKTFWTHHGFNFIRMGGAVWNKLTGKADRIGGTSTITQQLARNIFLASEKSARKLSRKIREAYYTIQIEKTLSKEQIIEAYLNTISLGFNSNGVVAASRAYFDKELKDLNLIECAQLAALPQSPTAYSPLKRIETSKIEDPEKYDIVTSDSEWTTYYNDTSAKRVQTVLRLMHEQEKLDDATYELAKADSIRNYLNPGVNIGAAANDSTYFSDYVTKTVMKDLQNQLGYTYQEAYDLLYKGGLIVNSTLDMEVQKILEGVYNDTSNFPKINLNSVNKDKNKNILNDDKSKVVLYAYNNMFDEAGNFVLNKDEVQWNADGSLVVLKGKRVNLFNVKSNGESDVRVDIKDFYEMIDEQLYSTNGSYWNIDAKYKSRDDAGNLIISKEFFTDEPEAFTKNENGTVTLSNKYFVVGSKIIQPQSAMVITDNVTGQLRAMVGGRGIKGKLLYNRATATRQPGSSMKPLAIYSTALQLGYDAVKDSTQELKLAPVVTNDGEPVAGVGKIFTVATVLDSIPVNQRHSLWPRNVDGRYTGRTSLRSAVQKSINACAVDLYLQIDPKICVENVLNLGITTLVLDGEDTDENASSLAMGGMIKGVTPLEMSTAYATFGNYGVHNESTCYTTVTDRKGNVILKSDSHPTEVLDEEVASLMLNVLESVVTGGGGSGAKLTSQPSAGKTGTTSDRYDIWFCGLTPKYSASTWVGCDSNINLGTDSTRATKLWKAVMDKVGKLDERGEFELKGDFVRVAIDSKTGQLPIVSEYGQTPAEDIVEELFIKGTEPTYATTNDNARGYAQVCSATGYLATPYCPSTTYKEYVDRPSGFSWEKHLAGYIITADGKEDGEEVTKGQYLDLIEDVLLDCPDYYCPLHNPDPNTYPVSPLAPERVYVPIEDPDSPSDDLEDAA